LYKKGSSQSLEDEELAMLRKELLTHADKLISATKEKEKQILQQYSNKDREEQNQVSIITSKAVQDLQAALMCVRKQANQNSKEVSVSQKRKGGKMWLNMKRRKKVRFSSTVTSPVKDSSNVEKLVDEQRDDDCNMNEVVHTSEDDEVTLLRNALHSLTQLQKLSIEAKESSGVLEERDLAEDTEGYSILNWLGLIDCCAFNTAIH